MYITKRSNSPFYQLAYFEDGIKKVRSTGAKTKTDALKYLLTYKENLEKEPKTEFITLKKFSETYLEHIRLMHSQHYYKCCKSTFKKVIEFINNKPLKDIKPNEIEM